MTLMVLLLCYQKQKQKNQKNQKNQKKIKKSKNIFYFFIFYKLKMILHIYLISNIIFYLEQPCPVVGMVLCTGCRGLPCRTAVAAVGNQAAALIEG